MGSPPPSTSEQTKIIAALRKNAMRYQRHLPDFVYPRVTTRSVDTTDTGDHLKQRDVLGRTSRVDAPESQ